MTSPQWCFACFRLDPVNACLWRATEAVPLPPKIFAVLHYLVTHPDRLVRKDELLDAVWPETAVTEAVLRVAIGAVRKVLGDTAQTPRFIATVPRRGYRFLVPVAEHTRTAPGPIGLVPPAVTLPAAEAERRRLTVLCCDLLDFPTLAGHLDPEDLREVVRAYRQACAEVMHRFDGSLAYSLGDGILVYFGYPVAHEDDAQRAVWTGLGILEAMDALVLRLALPPGERIAVQLGLHTGLAVVEDLDVGAHHESLALGETRHIAEWLQRLAAPNTLVISAATYQLIEGYFTCEALGEQTFRGQAQPLAVYRVLRASGAQSRFEVAAARGLTPLVGRVPEVALLAERWAQVKDGLGQVVLLSGEAGIGKSRLVQVLTAQVAAEPRTWLAPCQCSPYYQHTALYPLIDLLERTALRFDREEAPQQKVGKLEGFLVQYGLPLVEAVPLLAALLALPLPADYTPVTVSPEQQKQQTLHLLVTLLLRIAAQQPVLFVIEDLHWVDPSTLELLSLLVDQGPTASILTLFTFRPDFHSPWKDTQRPRWSRSTPRPTRCASRRVKRHNWSRSCWACGDFMSHGHSCTRRESSAKPCCAWHNVPTPRRSRSSPTLLLGRRGSPLARCLLPARTWRKVAPATLQISTVRWYSVWARIRVWPADSMSLRRSGCWGTRRKPWPASTRP